MSTRHIQGLGPWSSRVGKNAFSVPLSRTFKVGAYKEETLGADFRRTIEIIWDICLSRTDDQFGVEVSPCAAHFASRFNTSLRTFRMLT